MRVRFPTFVAVLVLSSSTVIAQSELLKDDEAAVVCAESLKEQLACKVEFCTTMVQLREAPAADVEPLKATCLKEIAVDGSGDLAARKKRCTDWAASRGKMLVSKGEQSEIAACWKKKGCAERIACWAPVFSKVKTRSAEAAKAALRQDAPTPKAP